MAAQKPVTIANIFALPREDVSRVLATQGRGLSPEGTTTLSSLKALNQDRAIAAMIYYNSQMIDSREEKDIIKHPLFYRVMSLTTSLEEGLKLLAHHPKPVREWIDEHKGLPRDLAGLVGTFFEPEEAYIRNLVDPQPALSRQIMGVTEQKAAEYAARIGNLEWVKLFDGLVIDWYKVLLIAIRNNHLHIVEWVSKFITFQWGSAMILSGRYGSVELFKYLYGKYILLDRLGRSNYFLAETFYEAIRGGNLPVVKEIYRNPDLVFVHRVVIEEAVVNKRKDVILWFISTLKGSLIGSVQQYLREAITLVRDDEDMMRWIREHST